MPPELRSAELAALGDEARRQLEAAHRARETALASCRETIRSCGLAIRAVHRLRPDEATARVDEADAEPAPGAAGAGARTRAWRRRASSTTPRRSWPRPASPPLSWTARRCPARPSSSVGLAAWLNGLAEAASELRRHLLDRLRAGETARGEDLLDAMEEVYDLLVTVEYPDAITGGLRRATDALRAVVERSRADVTTTVLQGGLQRAIEERLGRPGSAPS